MMQLEPWIAAIGTIALIIAVVIIVFLAVNAIFLGIALGFVNGRNREFGTTFVTALLNSLIGWIPCLGCILSLYFIKTRHEVGWGGAIAAYILTIIIAIVVIVAIMITFFSAAWAILWGLLGFPI